MYYEEAWFDGVLFWRGTPDGVWKQLTEEQLTAKLREAKAVETAKDKQIRELEEQRNFALDGVNAFRAERELPRITPEDLEKCVKILDDFFDELEKGAGDE